jgi:GTP-binding protein
VGTNSNNSQRQLNSSNGNKKKLIVKTPVKRRNKQQPSAAALVDEDDDDIVAEDARFVNFLGDNELDDEEEGEDDSYLEEDGNTEVYSVNEEEEEDYYYDDDDNDDQGPRVAGKRLPAEVRCFDTARIFLKGGDGGRGCVAFRREKFVPRGGPSGGNGGLGGSIWLEADIALNSLFVFRRQVHFRADPGTPGQGSDMHGAGGKDTTVKVPPGTIVRARDTGEPLAELVKAGDKVRLAAGGRGGRGNLAFKSSRNTAPAIAEFGEKGEELWVDLELKLVADVGIIGVPNAGKSTLLSVVSAAKPKIANYPFTTLVPNLGVCSLDFRTTVFADVPGLLEGAHAGVGLGHQFLRHTQRCRVLVHVIDGTSPDPLGDYAAIRQELELFEPKLAQKLQIVAYNKTDVPDSGDYWEDIKQALTSDKFGVEEENLLAISAVTGKGVTDLVRRVHAVLDYLGEIEQAASGDNEEATLAADLATVYERNEAKISDFTVALEKSVTPWVWTVRGTAIERFAQMTDWSYYEAARRFQRVLDASGINAALKAQGAVDGQVVVIGDLEFEYSDDKSDKALYDKWYKERRANGVVGRGESKWPHWSG